MPQAIASPKGMTTGEAGSALAFAVFAVFSLVVAAKAHTPEYAFHAYLFAAAGVAAVFAVVDNYYKRPAALPPLTLAGRPNYNMGPVKFGTIAAVVWGIAGFAVGCIIAFQLAFPALNLDLPWISFGRLRPLHTSAVIFAFGGNVLIATSFYVVQRTCRARLAGHIAPWFVMLGYNFFIVIAGTGYLLGITQGKEYAEPEWYADLFLTAVWVVYLLVFLGTLMRRAAAETIVAAGYARVGLDHFAKPEDALARRRADGRLHRNFQGYTTDEASALIGLGTSAIGSLPQGYVQNAPTTVAYRAAVNEGRLPTVRGRALSADDRLRRAVIERLMCDFEADLGEIARAHGGRSEDLADSLDELAPLAEDGLVAREGERIIVPAEARPLTRVVCAAFDRYLAQDAARHARAV